MTDRKKIVGEMVKLAKVKNPAELMDLLQDLGLVADEAVTIDDVANCDLLKSFNYLINVKQGNTTMIGPMPPK